MDLPPTAPHSLRGLTEQSVKPRSGAIASLNEAHPRADPSGGVCAGRRWRWFRDRAGHAAAKHVPAEGRVPSHRTACATYFCDLAMRLVWRWCRSALAAPFPGGRATPFGKGTQRVSGGGCGGRRRRRSLDGATGVVSTMPFLRSVPNSLWPRVPAHVHSVAMRPARRSWSRRRSSTVGRGRATAVPRDRPRKHESGLPLTSPPFGPASSERAQEPRPVQLAGWIDDRDRRCRAPRTRRRVPEPTGRRPPQDIDGAVAGECHRRRVRAGDRTEALRADQPARRRVQRRRERPGAGLCGRRR